MAFGAEALGGKLKLIGRQREIYYKCSISKIRLLNVHKYLVGELYNAADSPNYATLYAPNITPRTTTSEATLCFRPNTNFVTETALLPDEPADADEEVVETGVAMGLVGLYVTPLMDAATWNTLPPPYS